MPLALPLAGAFVFFLVSLATVRLVKPREPRKFFLAYAAGLLVVSGVVYATIWPLDVPARAVGLVACLLVQTVLCLTMWNAFYSLLWGFSGGLCHDLWNDVRLRHMDELVQAYQGDGEIDRMMARRMPNLVRGGYIETANGGMKLLKKGRMVAVGTLAAFKVFSLGMGGGVK